MATSTKEGVIDRNAGAVLREALREVGGVIRQTGRFFGEHNSFQLAASISFFAILSLIPVLFIVVSIASFILRRSENLHEQMMEAVYEFLPFLSDTTIIVTQLQKLVTNPGTLGVIGILFAVGGADMVFSSLQSALNRIFPSKQRRRFWRQKLISLFLVASVMAVLTFSIAFSIAVTAMDQVFERLGVEVSFFGQRFANLLTHSPLVNNLIIGGVVILGFTICLKVIPLTRVRWRFAAAGGLLHASLWLAAKFVFTWYVNNVAKINVIYGSLGTLVILILWIFYSALVFLLCAEFTATLRQRYGPRLKGRAVEGEGT